MSLAQTFFPNDTFQPSNPIYSIDQAVDLRAGDNLLSANVAEVAVVFTLPLNPEDLDIIKISDIGTGCTTLGNKTVARADGAAYTIQGLAENMTLDLPGKVYVFSFHSNDWHVSV